MIINKRGIGLLQNNKHVSYNEGSKIDFSMCFKTSHNLNDIPIKLIIYTTIRNNDMVYNLKDNSF